MVIALDTATEPQDAVDALFATDNFNAGLLIGQWAKAAMGGKKPIIATLDLAARHHRRRAAPQRLPAGLWAWARRDPNSSDLDHRRGSGLQRRTPTATRPKARPPWRTA